MADFEVTYADLKKSSTDFSGFSSYLEGISELNGSVVDSALFEGPAADFCSELLDALRKAYQKETSNFSTISGALSKVYEGYDTSDADVSDDLKFSIGDTLDKVDGISKDFDVFKNEDTTACAILQGNTTYSVQMVLGRPLTTKWTNYCAKVDGRWMIADGNNILSLFGGQTSSKGIYPNRDDGCDNYARGYCLYAQTGQIPEFGDAGLDGCGLYRTTEHCNNHTEQAKLAFQYIHDKGQPVIIHTNSPKGGSGEGHWLTVIGYKEGVNIDNVKIDDLIVVDSATGTIRACSDEPRYCKADRSRCSSETGYQVIHYDKQKSN